MVQDGNQDGGTCGSPGTRLSVVHLRRQLGYLQPWSNGHEPLSSR